MEYRLKIAAMYLIMGCLAVLVFAVDAFAYLSGATATISQCWLLLNKRCWLLTYLVAFLMGLLLQHVAIARPGGSEQPYIKYAILWALAFFIGQLVGQKWFWQYE